MEDGTVEWCILEDGDTMKATERVVSLALTGGEE